MKRFTSVGAFFIVMLIAGSVFASGVALTGVGARATALGGNYRAISNDWSAMFWNPAGIAQIKGLHVGGSFELVMPGAKYTFSQASLPFNVYKTSEFENESQTFPIPAVGIVYGMENNMSFGLSVFAPFGLGSKWDAMNTANFNSAYPEFEFEDDLQVIDIHPTFAFQVDKLSVGLGVSIVLNDIMIRKPTTTPNPLLADPNLAQLRTILTNYQVLEALSSPNNNYLLTDSELKGDGTGFGFNVGLKYDLTEDLSFGFSANYYNDVSLDGEITANTYCGPAPSQQALTTYSSVLDQMIAGGLLTAAQKQSLLAFYSGQTIPKYSKAKGDAKLPLPMTIGGGLAYKGISNLLLSADVSWTQWSQWDVIEIDMEDGTKQELTENWEDGIRFGVGAEYTVAGPFKIRAGYYTEPSAIPDETLTITIPDISRRHSVNFGLSYDLGPLSLFGSYEKIFIGDRTVDGWNYNATALGYDNMAGTYKMNVDNIMLGLGYNF